MEVLEVRVREKRAELVYSLECAGGVLYLLAVEMSAELEMGGGRYGPGCGGLTRTELELALSGDGHVRPRRDLVRRALDRLGPLKLMAPKRPCPRRP
jgi:hypothetical protein